MNIAAASLQRAWRAPRSAQFVVLLLACWLAVMANVSLWRAMLRLLPSPGGWFVVAGTAIVVGAAILLLLCLTAWGRWMKPVWLAMLLAAAISQHYMLDFGVVLDPTMMANVWQTDPREMRDLLSWPLAGNVLLVVGLPAWWLWQLPVRRFPWQRQLGRTLLLAAAAVMVAVLGVLALYSTLAPLVRNNMQLRYLPNPMTPLLSTAKLALAPLLRPPARLAHISGDAAPGPSHGVAGARPPLVVVVVGETARADHFGLNGYARDTTPELRQPSVLSYRDVWSCGTSTVASVPCMFSPFGQARMSSQGATTENLLDVAQAAGLAVLWVDNQSGCKRVCDRVPNASTEDIAATPIGQALCHAGECLDEALLVGLEARLDKLPEARRRNGVLLVLHMMGSHGPAYSKRSPPERKPFQPECKTTTLGDCPPAQLVNAYDNSIAYTDHVLAATIDWLRGQSGRYQASMIYVSDHGESLGEFGLFLHGIPYAFAPDAQKHVPLVAWLSDDTIGARSVDPGCLRAGQALRLSHDNLYHTVLGLLDVTSATYAPKLDFVGACRPPGAGVAQVPR